MIEKTSGDMVCDHFTRQYDEVGMLLRQCWCLEDEHS